MNVLELKGSIFDMVAHIESPKELTRLCTLINDFVKSSGINLSQLNF
jgi:hypothetical protein